MLSALHFLINSLGWTGLAWKLFDDSNMFLLRNSAKKIKGLDLVHLQPTFQPIPLKYFTTNQQGSAPAAKPPYPPPSSETGDGSRSTGFHFMTSAEYHSAYKSKRFSPLQVAEKMLEAIETSNKTTPPLLAVIKTDRQDVLRQARESTDRYAAGKPLSPLDGVPIVVKDEMDCLPYTTSLGTKFLDIKPERDAYCVARMKAAGCIVLGKANMHEIGIDVTK